MTLLSHASTKPGFRNLPLLRHVRIDVHKVVFVHVKKLIVVVVLAMVACGGRSRSQCSRHHIIIQGL